MRRLSALQREMLIDHIDAGLPVRPQQALTRCALLSMGLIRGTKPGGMHQTRTVLTDQGRQIVGMLLGEYADALMKAGFLDGDPTETPMQVLERLKARGAKLPAPEVQPISSTDTAS